MNLSLLAYTKQTRPASFESASSDSSRDRHRPPAAFRNALNYVRSKHLWYSDGNALIRCSSPIGVTVFRVHLTLLSRYALAFSGDLLASSHFDKVELSRGYIEASPSLVLDLSVQRTCEFEHFLRAIYEHRYFTRSTPLVMDAVLGMLKFGRKFQAEVLVTEALSRLRDIRLYAMRLRTTTNGRDDGDHAGEDHIIEDEKNTHERARGWEMVKHDETQTADLPVQWDPAYTLFLANLAHELNLTDVLAFALYICCTEDARSILQGSTLSDGTRTRLSDDLIAKLLDGKARLAAWSCDYVWEMNAEPMGSPVCVRGLALDGCWADFEFVTESRFGSKKMHPIEAVDEWRRRCLMQNLCGHCVRWVEEEHTKTIESLLNVVLPECFDLL